MRHPLSGLARALDAPLSGFDPNTLNPERAAADPAVALALVSERWDQLLQWRGSSTNVPEIHGQVDNWLAFKKDHVDTSPNASWLIPGYGPYKAFKALTADTSKTDDAIRGQANDLAVAEGNATKHGYIVPLLSIGSDGKVTRVDVDKKTGSNSPGPTTPSVAGRTGPNVVSSPPATPSAEVLHGTAHAVDQAAPGLPGAPRGGAGPAPTDPEPAVPIAVRAAALFTLAAASIAATVSMKEDSHRAGAAVSGALVVAGAAWAMFAPASKKKEEEKKS